VGDIDTAVMDSLKALDLKRPIREATEERTSIHVGDGPQAVIPKANVQTAAFQLAAW
jgi:hypothetical protein